MANSADDRRISLYPRKRRERGAAASLVFESGNESAKTREQKFQKKGEEEEDRERERERKKNTQDNV